MYVTVGIATWPSSPPLGLYDLFFTWFSLWHWKDRLLYWGILWIALFLWGALPWS